jgi:hypothetical protein
MLRRHEPPMACRQLGERSLRSDDAMDRIVEKLKAGLSADRSLLLVSAAAERNVVRRQAVSISGRGNQRTDVVKPALLHR